MPHMWPQMWIRNAVAEAVGAFAVTFVAILSTTAGSVTTYALAQGVVLVALIAALAHVSGGHFNPAVTLAMLLAKRIDLRGAVIYWGAQIVGGLVAAVLVMLAGSRDWVSAGAPVLATDGELNVLGAVLIEAVVVFVVVVAVYGTVVDQRAPLAAYPFAIGLAYAAGILATATLTGGALNPARAFGPALVGAEWGGTLAWLFGPLIGAVLAWLLYEYVIGLPVDVDEPAPDDVSVPHPRSEADDTAGSHVPAAPPPPADDAAEDAKDEVADAEEPARQSDGQV